MKKVEFDFIQAKFSIECDDTDSSEFVKEYSSLFFEKLSQRELYQSTFSQTQKPYTSNSQSAILGGEDKHQDITVPTEEIIDLFGITARQLSYLIDFSNESIKIIIRHKHLKGTKAEMQVKLSLLYCGACEHKGIKANTREIRNICNDYQCLDGNFAQNVKKQNYFNINGAVNADIMLTAPGKDKLVEIVKEIYDTITSN